MLKILRTWLSTYAVVISAVATNENDNSVEKTGRNISIRGNVFLLNGEPYQVVSGSLHYFRVPAEYWRDRLRKLRAAGLNAVSTYVEWSYHEPEERQYRFSDDYDVAQFIQTAAEEELLVLIRPGPYICSERDLGGLPYWLLSKYPFIKFRSANEEFMSETKTWMAVLFSHLTPLLYGNGGPIILVQIENEYGVYGDDMKYKIQLRDIFEEHVGTAALLYTADGTSYKNLQGGAVHGALPTINFGFFPTTVENVFHPLRRVMPQGPLMASEFYVGWLSRWGEPFATRSTNSVIVYLQDLLEHGINVNMYMFHGGTNFEFTSGAHLLPSYKPQITSYDYDAPLNEAGDPTEKYIAIRKLIGMYNPRLTRAQVPKASPKLKPMKVNLIPRLNLMSVEGRSKLGKLYGAVTGPVLPTFEQLRQRAGLVLYETKLANSLGNLTILEPHDRVYVYVDYKYLGVIDRMRVPRNAIPVESGSTLSLLVENQGRVNFGHNLNDHKGILSDVVVGSSALHGIWNVIGFNLEQVDHLTPEINEQVTIQDGPVIYEGTFFLPAEEEPLDSYLDTEGWVKGYVWVNGHNLGRFWPTLGPQRTLYVPGVWLRPSQNRIQILELEPKFRRHTISFTDQPVMNKKKIHENSK